MFQVIPKLVRSMTVSSVMPSFSPAGPSTGPAIVPVRVTGRASPRISSSPSMLSSSPSRRIAVDSNETRGVRWTSKNSGESR